MLVAEFWRIRRRLVRARDLKVHDWQKSENGSFLCRPTPVSTA
ncbi:hypothetical protein RISK_001396 [Rhodopirellula islandica]|uniref:Uncharacterized protein n=1 Tax=Rhodopirellula islandica TaxID=595434 RepID=A0A0J1BJA7_RHOIS|nr:hypothetical protein RISK_001396 [Rhodopirellula islandica]